MHVGEDPFFQLKSGSIHYSINELKSLMLDARITLIDGRMSTFERKSKTIKFETRLNKSYFLNYDLLVMAVGLVDKTIEDLIQNDKNKFRKELTHLYSIDNPYLYEIFAKSTKPDSAYSILTHKKKPQNVCVYGSSLNTISFISGLLRKGIHPERIHLVIPPRAYDVATKFNSNQERIEYEDQLITTPEAFPDNNIRKNVLDSMQKLGINVYDNFNIVDCYYEEEI